VLAAQFGIVVDLPRNFALEFDVDGKPSQMASTVDC
jgi:hypothetical protein